MVKAFDDNSGHGPESPTVTDLSHLVGDPFSGQSMSGSSTLTERPAFGAEGSVSEGSALTLAAGDQGGQPSQVHTALGATDPTSHTKDVH